MSRAILVRARRRSGRPVGMRRELQATGADLSLPISQRYAVKRLAAVIAGWSADPFDFAVLSENCGANGAAWFGRQAQHAGAVGLSRSMRGPTAAEVRSIAARFDQAGAL